MLQFTLVLLEVQPAEVLQYSDGKGASGLHDDMTKKASRLRGAPDERAFLVRRIEARGHVREAVDRQANVRTPASQHPPHFSRFKVKRKALDRYGAIQTRHTAK